MRNDFFKHILLSGGSRQNRTELETETLPYTFNSNSYRLRNYRIYGNTVNGESVGDLVTEGEHSGEYLVPVTVTNGTDTETTNLYLPEQIKMVGDEAEYIDYGEQKQHRVRKNLLPNTATSQTINGVTFTVNSDGSVTCNGTASTLSVYKIPIYLYASTSYILNGCPLGGSNEGYSADLRYSDLMVSSRDTGNGINYTCTQTGAYVYGIRIAPGYTCNNLTFYPMIRKADISDDTYEPYIKNTDLDVTLPALPTLKGTNVLSVGTEVQPSKVYLQGKISEAEIVSAEPVQTNVQSLQPLSLDENAELDVMPSDKNEFQTNDISEMPVEDENSIEEILETENLETTGDDENAE